MWLLNPHVSVSRIDDIDFAKLRSVGVRYIVFDKDNTLTAHLQDNYFDSQLQQCVHEEVANHFSLSKEVLLVSNASHSLTTQQKLAESLGLRLLLTNNKKKPENFPEILRAIHADNEGTRINHHEIAFIGDRLFTDVLLANLNGAIAIHTKPHSAAGEGLGIRIMRAIEDTISKRFNGVRSNHFFYSNIKKINDFQAAVTKINHSK